MAHGIVQLNLLLIIFVQANCFGNVVVRHSGDLVVPECYSKHENCDSYQDCCDSDRIFDPRATGITCESALLCTNRTCDSLLGQYSVYMVTQCPANNNQTSMVHSRCQSGFDGINADDKMSLPVFSNRSGLLYRNAYCAMCHGETIKLESAQLVFFCNGSASLNCKSVAIVESRQAHVCYPNLADANACKDAYPSLTETCTRAPTRYEVCQGVAYRNSYCRMCQLGWYAPWCEKTEYALWNLRERLDYGLLGVYVGFRDLDANRPGRGFSPRDNGTSLGAGWRWSVSLYATHTASIAALLMLLAAYLSVRSLRNRPGLCLCCHAVCVLVWEVLAIFTRAMQPTQTACLSLLLLSYFCLCSIFSWASVFGFDLLRSLASNLPARGPSRWLMLLVWLAPAILTACVGFLHSRFGLFDLTVCQFAPCHKWLMLALSLTPLGLALTVNLSVAAAVCVILRRRTRTAQRLKSTATGAKARRMVGAALRVSVAAGAAWLPQFCLANLPPSDAINQHLAAIVGEHLAALHGVLLAVCFCCASRRVRQLMLRQQPQRLQQQRPRPA